MSQNKFVFVVCGAKEHIDTLHFSIRYLQHFSKNEIIVVTDSARNEIQVAYQNVVDVKTPENFTNHQASNKKIVPKPNSAVQDLTTSK